MNEKKKLTLCVFEKIADDILLKNTVKRYRLLHKKRTKKPFYIASAIAAVLLVAILTPFAVKLFSNLGKQVPVYTGMTVSRISEAQTVEYRSEEQIMLSGGTAANPPENTETTVTTDPLWNSNASAAKSLYYADPDEDVYITIHIDNPDAFEILSFTLNGEKYSSYMFEAGSTMEELVLKVNVGSESGIKEYTIDAIKYIDGTEIKDVRMEGNRTVKISVAYTTLPSASISNVEIGKTTFAANVTIHDPLGLIEMSNGEAYILLDYGVSGYEPYAKQSLSVGENSVLLENLDEGGYTYRIVVVYDALDELGMKERILKTGTFVNEPSITIETTHIDSANLTVSYRLKVINEEFIDTVRVELLEKGNDVPVAFYENDLSQTTFCNLKDATEYQIRLTYIYDRGDWRGEQIFTFTTDPFLSSIVISRVVDGTVTKEYSNGAAIFNPTTVSYMTHNGIDITPTGSDLNVYSCTSGTVSQILEDPDFGVCVSISYINYTFVYQNLERGSITVKVGDRVSVGDVIAKVGQTASLESAEPPHLHFEVLYNGVSIDPERLMD